jgi:putative transposase
MVQYAKRESSKIERVLNKKECCDLVVNNLNQFISIPIQGKLTQTKIFQSLVGMAVSHQSIHSISHSLTLAPCETSLRYHLNKLSISELEITNSQILAHSVDEVLKAGHSYQFAIDFTHDPYYGEIAKENVDFIIRHRLKKSTTEFYSYVTLYVITKDRQLTLAVFPVRQGVSKVGYIARCLDVISELGVQIEVLCLDREFYAKKVISFLQEASIPFIMPVRRHSNRMKSLLEGTKSRFGTYIMKNRPSNLQLKIAIVVKYFKGKSGKHGSKNLGYVFHGLTWNPGQVHETYRSRFSIESSYRMRNRVKPKTSSRNPLLRYLFTIISFLLKNIWLVLLWRYFSPIKKGPRTIDRRVLRFDLFCLFVWEYIKRVLKFIDRILGIGRPV